MTDAILKGIALGFIIALMVGPVFFMLISTSIKKGFTEAVMVAIGVMLSDAFFISVAYFGSSVLLYLNEHQKIVSMLGGVIIAAYGLMLIFKKAQVPVRSLELPEEKEPVGVFLIKGFLLNSINPSVLLFWIVIASTIPVKEQYTSQQALMFYSVTLATILSTDMIKAYSASRLRKVVTAVFLVWMNRLSGSALVIYGISISLRAF